MTGSPGKPGRPFSNLLPGTEEKNQKLPVLLLMQAPKKELVKAEKGTELHEKKKKPVVARWDRIAWHLQRHFKSHLFFKEDKP